MNPTFYFNGNILNSVEFFTIDSIVIEPIQRDTKTHVRSYDDGNVPTVQFYRSRKIRVAGHFATDYDTMQIKLRELDKLLRGVNKTILFDINGDFIQFMGTLESQTLGDPLGGYRTVSLVFDVHGVFGENTEAKTYNAIGITDASDSTNVTNDGSYDALPTITIDINSLTATSSEEITIMIGDDIISVIRSFTAGEQLVINCKDKKTTVDGTEVSVQGKYPTIDTGLQTVTYTDTFTVRNVDMQITFNERY